MTVYEESYKNYLAWLTPRELLQEYKIMCFLGVIGNESGLKKR